MYTSSVECNFISETERLYLHKSLPNVTFALCTKGFVKLTLGVDNTTAAADEHTKMTKLHGLTDGLSWRRSKNVIMIRLDKTSHRSAGEKRRSNHAREMSKISNSFIDLFYLYWIKLLFWRFFSKAFYGFTKGFFELSIILLRKKGFARYSM